MKASLEGGEEGFEETPPMEAAGLKPLLWAPQHLPLGGGCFYGHSLMYRNEQQQFPV